jgi:hypothetical protein
MPDDVNGSKPRFTRGAPVRGTMRLNVVVTTPNFDIRKDDPPPRPPRPRFVRGDDPAPQPEPEWHVRQPTKQELMSGGRRVLSTTG